MRVFLLTVLPWLIPSIGFSKVDPWIDFMLTDCAPLEQPAESLWPLTFFDGPEVAAISDTQLADLHARGLAPTLRLERPAGEQAARLRKAGLPVILRMGRGFVWPESLWPCGLVEESAWAHRYPPAMTVPEKWKRMPHPDSLAGWPEAAEQMRSLARDWLQAEVTADALWLDCEGEPLVSNYAAAINCLHCAPRLPVAARKDKLAYETYTRRLWLDRMSSYVAAPLLEHFPDASVTNWAVVLSSPQRPVPSWDGKSRPLYALAHFNTTNPVAYGFTRALPRLRRQYPAWAEQPDRLYWALLLEQVSADATNRLEQGLALEAVPWVARWVPEGGADQAPAMSREAYRDALWHLWLRGIRGMQVFNPAWGGDRASAEAEVLDAAQVYAEVLAYEQILLKGNPIKLEPLSGEESVLISGLATEDAILLRLSSLGGDERRQFLTLWGETKSFVAPPYGATYYLKRSFAKGKAKP